MAATLAFFGIVSPAYSVSCSIDACGYLYSGGAYTTLSGPSGSAYTYLSGINNAGQIVGSSFNITDQGFLYSGGSDPAPCESRRGPIADMRRFRGTADTERFSLRNDL
ncbi:MAG: hypothetical protein ABSG53_27700 [Thermoguttaceae bacterium]